MTTRKYSSRSQQTTLSAPLTSSATSATVVSGSGLLGGITISSGEIFTVVIDPDTALEEIVDVSAVSTNTLTIVRGIDGSTGQAHSAGAVVRHMAIGRDYREANTHIESSTGIHGIASTSSVVGTTDTQTLSNKTLVSPTVTGTPGVGTSIVFEGATDDAYETTLTVVDPTADRTITLPNVTGTVAILDATQTFTNKTLTSPIISGTPVITGLSSAGMSASSAAPKDYVDSILGSATAASTSATSAATSATSAATSASSAATSATSSATSATASATSATASATSATASASSASAAATSATSAATSATSAAASATAAATSATSAAASATSAANSVATIATYASNASTSANSAATSASSAATSASSAATSASTMAASVSAAATSATSAATSASSAATSATSSATSATASATSATASATSATASATSATASATSATASATSATASATSASAAATSASSAATSASSAATSASSAAASASDTATIYDNFDDRYLGAKTTAPSVDNDGNTLLVGAIYWNSTLNNMYVWSGTAWVQIASTSVYSAPTIGSQIIASGTTYANINDLTINSTVIPTSATLAKTADKLSAFAATTSAELAGVISDETGSGSLVFATAPTLSGALAAADPTVALGIATKQYVDAVVGNTNYHAPVKAATNTNFAATYNNGTSGVGATLTSSTTGVFTFDGVTVALTDRILVKSQTTDTQNGIYTVTTLGAIGVACVLTRATDADNNPAGEMANGDVVFCTGGTINSGKTFINASTNPITIGTSAIIYSEYTTALPSQTGNSGKYLTTDGTSPSWGAASGETFNPLLLMGA